MDSLFFEQKHDFSDEKTQLECFQLFDEEDKQYLNKDDFYKLAQCVLKVDGESLDESSADELFARFDRNSDDKIDAGEFKIVCNNWIKPLLHPVTALIVVDVQNDFIDGSLAMKNCPAKQDGKEVIPIINQLIENVEFNIVVYSIDYHPEDHISFYENRNIHKLSENQQNVDDIKLFDVVTFAGPPEVKQTLWPKHCIIDTFGAELHPDLKVAENSISVHKGENSKTDSYSAFWDNSKISQTKLHSELQQREVTHVFVCGVALDYCVAFTALDALELGYATVLIEDAARGTDISNIEVMKNKLISNSCVIAPCSDIIHLTKGKDTPLEFAKVLGSRK